MSRSNPLKIIIEFDDGSKSEMPFGTLPSVLQHEILKQPFASKSSPDPAQEKFLVLEWQDGWREVMEVDARCTDINRYYVITRPEDVGRLSLNKEDGYPELIEIQRDPLNLKKITFLDTFELNLEQSHREGKKIDHFFALKKESNMLFRLRREFGKALAEEGISLTDLRTQDKSQLIEIYEKISQRMGITAAQRQQDLFDFIAYLASTAKH